jgi:hypothetical protein
MQFNLRLIPAAAAALVLAACGGGSNPGPSPTLTPSKGVAVDGYLQFSKVVCDANGNGLFDTGETVVYTLADGSFSYPAGCTHGILVSGGKSADTELEFVGLLKSPAGATVASPLTTLISAGMTQDQIIKALDLPSNTDLLKTDPAATTGGVLNNPELLKKTLAVQQLLQKVTELSISLSSVTGSVASEAVYANVASTFATMLKTSAVLIKSDGTLDSDVVKTMVTTAVTNVAASTAVPSEVKTALSAAVNKAGGAANVSAVAVVALAEQGNALLKATDAADITAVTLAKQGNNSIAVNIKTAISEDKLNASTSPASLATLAENAGTTTPPTTTTGVVIFSESGVVVIAYGDNGGGYASIDIDPTEASNKVLRFTKKANDMVYMGATIVTSASALKVTPVVLTTAKKTLSLRIYSPAIGEKILLKLENSESDFQEVEALTTKANAWETLTFTFASAGTYQKVNLMPHFGTQVSADTTFYVDDLNLSPTSAAIVATPYLYLANNAISLTDGASSPTTTTYTLADFTGSGINVKWPMPSTAALKLNLAEMGTFTMAQGQTLEAAVSITQESPSGSGEVKAYIDNISVTKTGSNITVSVPALSAQTLSKALIYGVTGDGNKSAIIDFKSAVAGITNTLTSAADSISTILLGDVVNYAVNGVSNDFTGMYSLTGKYKVTIVVTELPLRKADGSEFPLVTVNIPTQLDSAGKAVAQTLHPVTGRAIVGYINLTK